MNVANAMLWQLQGDKAIESMKNGKRLDGRKVDEYRTLAVQKNVSESADGSARVQLGKTDIMAGIKLELGKPYPDSPNKGAMSTGGELLPMSFEGFEFGPPTPEAIEVSRVVDRALRESGAIDFEKLSIIEGELVWMAFIDFYVINHDGNLFDAGCMASLAALNNTQMPKLEDNKIVRKEYSGKLEMHTQPLLSSFAKVGNTVVLDPNFAEEQALSARFHVGTTEDGSINAFQKGAPGSFSLQELDDSIATAMKATKAIRKLL